MQGAGEAVEMAAWMGKMGVLKVLLQHWTGEGDMVRFDPLFLLV